MKKTTKVVLGSVMTMAMCASLIAGSTLALFSSEDSVNIAITSGKVDVQASVDEATLTGFSAEWVEGAYHDKTVEGTFTDGGTYAYVAESNELTLDRIVAGDGVEFDLKVTNKSNISIRYQVRLTMSKDNSALAKDLAIYVVTKKEGENWKAFGDPLTLGAGECFASAWSAAVAPAGESSELTGAHVRIQLPIGTEQPKDAEGNPIVTSCALTVGVLAVQGNAATCEETGVHNYVDDVCTWCGEENLFKGESLHQETDEEYIIKSVPDDATELVVPAEINGKKVVISGDWKYGYKNETLQSVVIGEGIEEIGSNVFANCLNLTHVELPDSLKKIDSSAFKGSSIEEITLPEGLESIGGAAFMNTHLVNLVIPDSVTSIGTNAFKMDSLSEATLQSVTIGSGVREIPASCFEKQKLLKTVILKEGVTTIGESAFSSCAVEEIVFPKSLESIGQFALRGLKKITIPSVEWWLNLQEGDISATGNYQDQRNPLFCNGGNNGAPSKYNLENETQIYVDGELLVDLVVPESITEIRPEAFCGYSPLKSVSLHSNVSEIGSYAFNHCPNLRVVYDFTSSLNVTAGKTDNGYVAAKAIKVFTSQDQTLKTDTETAKGFEFYTDESEKHFLLGATTDDATELTLPANYNGDEYSIVAEAFRGYFTLTSIVFPENCKIAEDGMGDYAFADLVKLEKIEFKKDCNFAIGKYAFSKCASKLSSDKELTVTLDDDSVTKIGSYAFSNVGQNFKRIVIPTSVVEIGAYAFDLYTSGSGMSSITFTDTKGWTYSTSSTSGTLDVSDPTENAKQLSSGMNPVYGQGKWKSYTLTKAH